MDIETINIPTCYLNLDNMNKNASLTLSQNILLRSNHTIIKCYIMIMKHFLTIYCGLLR